MSFHRCLFAALLVASISAAAQLKGIDLHGNSIDLAQVNSGKVNVLIFVRTDCPISNRYAPTLQKLSAEYAGKAKFWLVYPDASETAEAITRHLRDYHYTRFSAVRDPEQSLVRMAHARITPEAAVFDVSSRLLYHGRIDDWYQSLGHVRPQPTTHELNDAIRAALDGRAVPIPETKAVGCYIADVK